MVCHPSIRPPFSKIFSKTAGPIKAKFYMEPQWDGRMKVCARGLGHMTKMAPRPYMRKTLQKPSSPEPKGQWPCGLVCIIGVLGPIIVCSNDDPRLTLTYFTARSNLVSYAFIWGKLLESHLMEETYSKWPQWQKVYVYIKILTPRGCLPLPRGYIHVLKHEKICLKSDFKDIFLKFATNGQSDGFSVDIRILSTKGCLPLPRGFIHVEKY